MLIRMENKWPSGSGLSNLKYCEVLITNCDALKYNSTLQKHQALQLSSYEAPDIGIFAACIRSRNHF